MLFQAIKIFILFLAIACGEVANGTFRTIFLNPKFGDFRARQIAILPGILIIYLIGWLLVPWINPANSFECYLLGLFLVVGMAMFDIFFGRFVFKFSWEKIARDFNVFSGNLLTLGFIALLFMPVIVFLLRIR